MNCTEAIERMSEALDDRLSDDERRLLDTHLGSCSACRAEWDALGDTVNMLRAVGPRELPPGLIERVQDRVGAARPPLRIAWHRLNRAPVRAAVAAALLIAVCMYGLMIQTPPRREGAADVHGRAPSRGVSEAAPQAAPGVQEELGLEVGKGDAVLAAGEPIQRRAATSSAGEPLAPAAAQVARVKSVTAPVAREAASAAKAEVTAEPFEALADAPVRAVPVPLPEAAVPAPPAGRTAVSRQGRGVARGEGALWSDNDRAAGVKPGLRVGDEERGGDHGSVPAAAEPSVVSPVVSPAGAAAGQALPRPLRMARSDTRLRARGRPPGDVVKSDMPVSDPVPSEELRLAVRGVSAVALRELVKHTGESRKAVGGDVGRGDDQQALATTNEPVRAAEPAGADRPLSVEEHVVRIPAHDLPGILSALVAREAISADERAAALAHVNERSDVTITVRFTVGTE